MDRFRQTLLAGVTLAWIGCSGGGNRMADTVPETLVGEIQLTGSAPAIAVTLVTAEGRAADLVGALRAELQNLSGVEVAVHGRATDAPREFEVASYEIRSVEGQRPLVGILVERDGEFWLEAEEPVRLVNAPSRLRDQVGAKLWVLGRRMEGGLYPQTYGVIRAAGRE